MSEKDPFDIILNMPDASSVVRQRSNPYDITKDVDEVLPPYKDFRKEGGT